ncbi:MAG TPA: M56 family metallopeptidase [Lacunisphaera sp.]|jgi:beta-lactamase regulating signal transducer with metallopeptidase domain
MNLLVTTFAKFAGQSWWIGGLICCLGILRWMAKGRIPQQVFFAGWIVIALALLLPISIPVGWMPTAVFGPHAPSSPEVASGLLHSPIPGISGPFSLANSGFALPIPAQSALSLHGNGFSLLALIWLSGVMALITIRATLSYQFHRRLVGSSPQTDPRYEAAVIECAKALHIKIPIPVFVSDAAGGPAIGGLWKPYLLIPSSLAERLSENELRLVMLHELGHWRRGDNAVSLLIHCALIAHWFNPMAWIFAGMARADCELACDEFVLGHMTAADPLLYGTTLLKVLATVQPRSPSPAVLGILGTKQQLKRRFEMIARFKNVSFTRLIAGWSVIGVVAIVAVTGKLNASDYGSTATNSSSEQSGTTAVPMKHYVNTEWKFAVDIPTSWNAFPPVSSNSHYEVVRFESNDGGKHTLLIVFRNPRDPKQTPEASSKGVEDTLARSGFGNFGHGKKTLGSNEATILDFDKAAPNDVTWSCRHYFIDDGTLEYVFGFGTENKREAMTGVYDNIVKSFQTSK